MRGRNGCLAEFFDCFDHFEFKLDLHSRKYEVIHACKYQARDGMKFFFQRQVKRENSREKNPLKQAGYTLVN